MEKKRKMYANNNSNKNKRDRSASKASKDETIDSLPENVKSIARSLRIAIEQMHLSLAKAKELILETARQLDEQHVEEQAKICKKIKEILKDKIQEGKISEGWIEECLPGEYKRRYTRTKSQQNHLSRRQQPELVVSTKGNQISQRDKPSDIDGKAPDTEVMSSLFERQEDRSPSAGEASPAAVVNQSGYNAESSNTDDSASYAAVNSLSHPSDKQIGQECTSCLELQDEVIQLKEALQRISMQTVDQVPATGLGFPIPKEKYEMVIEAMDRSKSAIFVECDESKKFVRAVADVDI